MYFTNTHLALLAGTDPDASANYIEECINKKEPLVKVLRLLVLLSNTCGGVKVKQLEFFKREILQTYGFEYLFTLNNLEKLGLLKKQEGKSTFAALRKSLRLIVEEIDEGNPTDIAYPFAKISLFDALTCIVMYTLGMPLCLVALYSRLLDLVAGSRLMSCFVFYQAQLLRKHNLWLLVS